MENEVRQRYSAAAQQREAVLCCPVEYDPRYLEVIPREVLERDYGCGDPSAYVRPGDTVLDLGSGGGKICFIASQIVGKEGRAIGIDMNDEMLELARKAAPVVAKRIGYANVSFHRGRIQDLALDLDQVDAWLGNHPVRNAEDRAALDEFEARLRVESPLVPDDSVDILVSNCVLNLVRTADKSQLIREIFRVLKRGGRIAISDIVSDEPVPKDLREDPQLWTGCISGAFEEEALLRELENAGFYGITLDKWAAEPFGVVQGIEFRPVTITAKKGKDGPGAEARQAVIYRGPWKRVEDDEGHVLRRGERTAVCAKTFDLLTRAPYGDAIIPIEPRETVPHSERQPFAAGRSPRRHPRESKGAEYRETCDARPGVCGPEGCG